MGIGLDLTGVQESGGTIPAGRYVCVVEKAEVAPTRSGGEMIKVQLKVCEQGPFFGRSIFDQFNIKNANPQAVQIGLGQLKSFMKAAGHPNPNRLESTAELQGLKVTAVTKVDNDPTYGENTRVKSYAVAAGAPAPSAGAVPAAAPAAQNANPFG